MFVKINLAVRYVLAFTLMYCSCLSIRAMEQVDDTVDFSEPKYCSKHTKDIDKFCVMQRRIDCITKYIEEPSKYYDDIKICEKEIKSQKHEEHSSGRSMSHPNYMTPIEKDDLQRRINCITKYIKEASKYYDGEKEINSQKHEEHSSGRSMSHPNYMTPMEKDNLQKEMTSMERKNLKESLKELKKEEKMRLSDLYDIWGCYCEHYNDEVDEKLNKLKEEFGKDKIYDLINAVKKLKKG